MADETKIRFLALSIATSQFTTPTLPSGKDLVCAINERDALVKIAEAARDFIWEPENWEAYIDAKTSNSAAWPPEFLLLAEAIERHYGAMPVDEDES